MTQIKMFVRRPFVIGVGLVAVALLLALCLPTDSTAIPCGYQVTYYSDASYTTVVGAYGAYPQICGCGTYRWGATSAYSQGGYITVCIPPEK